MIDHTHSQNATDPKFQRVCQGITQEMAQFAIPGVAVGIATPARNSIAVFGITNLEHPLPITEDTLFQIGSITKTYVAMAIMRLREMGRLELDVPIRTYLPDMRLADESVAEQVTLRHLLTHTGGWEGDYFDDFGFGEDALAKMVAKMADLPQLTPLGEVWSYNNSGFYLAGRVIEVVTGDSFEQAIADLVFEPLGLKESYFFPHEVITHRFAVGHEVVDKQTVVARPWAIGRAAHPAGGITCTMKDLLCYARFNMGDGCGPDGTRLLSRQSLELMHPPLVPSTGISMLGLSWGIITVGGTRILGHSGATKGQISVLRVVPDHGFAVAVFANNGSAEARGLCGQLVDLATEQYLGLTPPEATPLELPEARLAAYVGSYEAAGITCELYLRNGELIIQATPKGGFPTSETPAPDAPPPVRIGLYAEDRLVILDEPFKGWRGEFLRDREGRITWLRLAGRIHAKQS